MSLGPGFGLRLVGFLVQISGLRFRGLGFRVRLEGFLVQVGGLPIGP